MNLKRLNWYCIFFVHILFFVSMKSNYCKGQSENIQNLEREYLNVFEKNENITALNQLIDILLLEGKYLTADSILTSFQASNKNSKALFPLYLLKAKTKKYLKKNEEALFYFHKALKGFTQDKNINEKFKTEVELIEFYRSTNDLIRADNLAKSLILSKPFDSKIKEIEINSLYNRYAAVLNQYSTAQESIKYSYLALEIANMKNDINRQAISHNEIGFSYLNIRNADSALFHYNRAYELWSSIKCHRDAIHARRNWLDFHSYNGSLPWQELIDLYTELLNLIKETNTDYPLSGIYLRFIVSYVGLNDYENAYKYKALEVNALNYEKAQESEMLMNELKEKYDNENLMLKNKDIQREINLRNKSLQESHNRFWLISIFLLLLAISFIILYLTWLNNRKKNKLLEIQNTQKNFLIQEIHHRVKNNLQFVKSILSMQESVPEISANETIEDISRRIDAMYLLHELLYQDKNITQISSKEYFDKLISNSLNIYTLDQKIILTTDIEEIELKVEQLISLGLIVAELITNSAKHVFNQTINPELSIKMSKQNDLISLIVKDNGLENDNIIEDNRHKLGVRMIHIFVRQINADLIIKKENGYCVEIKFKP